MDAPRTRGSSAESSDWAVCSRKLQTKAPHCIWRMSLEGPAWCQAGPVVNQRHICMAANLNAKWATSKHTHTPGLLSDPPGSLISAWTHPALGEAGYWLDLSKQRLFGCSKPPEVSEREASNVSLKCLSTENKLRWFLNAFWSHSTVDEIQIRPQCIRSESSLPVTRKWEWLF